MKFTALSVAAMAAVVSSTAIDITKRDTPLSVTLTPLGNSKVKASVTNTGVEGYNVFYKGSFLDNEAPVDKLEVTSAGKSIHNITAISIYSHHPQPPKPPSRAPSSA